MQIKTFIKTGVKCLNNHELIHFNAFLLKQIQLISKRTILTMYRGDSLGNLCRKLGINYDRSMTDYTELAERLFMIGEKSRNFHSNKLAGRNNVKTIGIDDCNEAVFEDIFERLNDYLLHDNTDVKNFFDRNDQLALFFGDKANKKNFISSIMGAREKEQRFLRNYYWILLHQLDAIGYRDNSHLVSCSTSYEIAREFSGHDISGNGVIIHGWSVVSRSVVSFRKYSLPTYKGGPYKREREISVFAGLLPHYITGIEILGAEQLLINPNLLLTPINREIFVYGLDIDQGEFDKVLGLTGYDKSFVVQGDYITERK